MPRLRSVLEAERRVEARTAARAFPGFRGSRRVWHDGEGERAARTATMRRVQRACAVGVLAGLAAACGPAPSGDDETETDASESGTASGSTSADALDAPARTD